MVFDYDYDCGYDYDFDCADEVISDHIIYYYNHVHMLHQHWVVYNLLEISNDHKLVDNKQLKKDNLK